MSKETSVRSWSVLRGTLREFETTMIIRPDASKEAIRELVGRLQRVLANQGGRMLKIDNWGLRTLAYPIRRNKKGIYLYTRFLGNSDTVKELERNLRIYEEVMRYLSVRIDENVDPNARPDAVSEEELEAASDSAPDPLEIAAAERAEAERLAAAERAERAERDSNDDDDEYDNDDDDDEDND